MALPRGFGFWGKAGGQRLLGLDAITRSVKKRKGQCVC